MSSEPEMSDAQFTNVFSIMIGGLIVLTIVLIIVAAIIGSGVNQSDLNAQARDSQVVERIEPAGQITVGEVASSEPAASGSGSTGGGGTEAASGESVYQNTCAACHANGVAGAPTHGDKAAWSDRIAKGKDTLYQHAIEGFQGDAGMMPAKGGNAGLSDEAVKGAVDYMVSAVSDSGGDTAASDSAEAGTDSGSGTSEPAQSDAASGADGSGTDASGSDGSDTAASGADAAGADGSDTAASGADTADADAPSGESVYQSSCMACHASGVAGAPKLGDSAAWSDRIAKGEETLYQHAIEGFQGETGMMPAKGGNTSLSDAAVKAAVDYMVEQAE